LYRFDIGGDLFGLLLQRFDIQAQVFLDDLSVFFPSFQEGLREEIAMPVRKRELMFDMRRFRGVGNFARVDEYFNRVGGCCLDPSLEWGGVLSRSDRLARPCV
jgi:hypothetical protein